MGSSEGFVWLAIAAVPAMLAFVAWRSARASGLWLTVFGRVAAVLGARARQVDARRADLEVGGHVVSLIVGYDRPGTVTLLVDGLPDDLTIHGRSERPTAVPTGDLAFDEAVYVDGPPLPTAARLDAPTRARIAACVVDGAVATKGAWRLTLSAPVPNDDNTTAYAAVLVEQIHRLIPLADAWRLHIEPLRALTWSARNDEEPGVRAMALLRLAMALDEGPMCALARELRGDGLASADPGERAAAVILARYEGDAADLAALRQQVAALPAGPERDAVQWAIEAIRDRLAEHAHTVQGALSVADGPSGALSVAEGQGDVSLDRRGAARPRVGEGG